MRLLFTLVIFTVFLGACETTPKEAAPPQTAAGVSGQAEPGRETVPFGSPQPGEAGKTSPRLPPLTGEAAKVQAHKLALNALDLLDQGKEDEAKVVLQQALALDREDKIATSMMRQIVVDPVTALGSKSFKYTVRPGETLSMIAQRFLGNRFEFYGLARYNDIAIPRDVHTGQVIKVPGDAPPEPPPRPKPPRTPEPAPVEAEAPATPPTPPVQEIDQADAAYQNGMKLLRSGRKEQAYAAFQQAAKLDPQHKQARLQAEQVRQDLIQSHSRIAMGAFHRQDLALSIKEWDKVLELDPGNESARLKRQQAVDLAEKIKKFSPKP